MTLFSENPEIKKIIESYPWPEGNRLEMEFVDEYSHDGKRSMLIILFRPNFITFSGEEQMKIASIINDLMATLISRGYPSRLTVAKGETWDGE